jgi:hypothetical protein
VRIIVGTVGALMLLGGLALAFAGFPGSVLGAIWLIVGGSVLVIAVLIEVSRYRAGPGGGEPAIPGPPFRPTDEVFVDPTSNRSMRVYVDATTGERRYVAEN